MGLDQFGYPAPSISTGLLMEQTDFGDSVRELEAAWEEWIAYNPFDTDVATRLAELTSTHLSQTGLDNKTTHRLKRRLNLLEHRIERYDMESYGQ